MKSLVVRALRWTFLLGLLTTLHGCSSLVANTIAIGPDQRLMLKGRDPVAYFTEGKDIPGDQNIKTTRDGVTYRFVSEEHKKMFEQEPARYAPQFGGYCSNGIVYAIPWGGDPDTWKIIDDKLYMFGGHGSKNYFLMDEKRNLELAHHYWETEVKDHNAVMQRYKRLMYRVPHYKTGQELEAEWQARKKS
jgi:YHS domain-containing protein